MEWFAGNIEDAVLLSKQNKLIFVVGIFGQDNISKDLENFVDCDIVKNRLENKNDFVCVKVDPNSEAYMNFAQIYQLVPVPSIFFLGVDGTPITVLTEATSQNDMLKAVENVLTLSGKTIIADEESSSLYHLSDAGSDSSISICELIPSANRIDVTSSQIDNVVNEIPNIDIRTPRKSDSSKQKAEHSKTTDTESNTLDQASSVIAENSIMKNSINASTNTSFSETNFRDVNQDFLKSEIELKRNESATLVESPNNYVQNIPLETEKIADRPKVDNTENLNENSFLPTQNEEKIENNSLTESNQNSKTAENVIAVKPVIEEKLTEINKKTKEASTSSLKLANAKNKSEENIIKSPKEETITNKPSKTADQVSFTDNSKKINDSASSNSKEPLNDAITEVQKAIQEENNKKKELLEEVKRARFEEDEAKKQILMKIASDKLERIARYGNTFDTPKSVSQQQIPTVKQQLIDKDLSRIQFRAPDGQSHTHVFNMNEKFAVIRDYVRNNIIQNAGVREFTLATNFPRHEFVTDDDDKTLLELELYPSASILIINNNKPNKAAQVLAESGGLVNMIKSIVWTLVNPFYIMFASLGNYFNGNKNNQQNTTPQAVNLDNLKKSGKINDGASSSDNAKNKLSNSSNIHRLRDSKDSDDENATWNGNSTQQQ